jgi:hypothetical protein
MQGANGTMVEQHEYCIETNIGGDQVLWKVTPESHPMNASSVPAVHEAIAGTGKYADISMTIKTTCRVASTSSTGYTLSCERTP